MNRLVERCSCRQEVKRKTKEQIYVAESMRFVGMGEEDAQHRVRQRHMSVENLERNNGQEKNI